MTLISLLVDAFFLLSPLQGGDIDTLVVAPMCIERADFFTSFLDKLKARPEVSDIHAVEETVAPVIQTVFSGVEVCGCVCLFVCFHCGVVVIVWADTTSFFNFF